MAEIELTRRQLIGGSVGLAATLATAGQLLPRLAGAASPSREASLPIAQIGIITYTVQISFNTNPLGTLQELRDIGYRLIEPSPFDDLPAPLYRKLCDEAGMRLYSHHAVTVDLVPLKIDEAHILGCRNLTVTSGPNATNDYKQPPSATEDDVKAFAEQMNEAGERARQAGLQLLYHNHWGEFAKYPNGRIPFDILWEEFDRDLVKFEMDVGWVYQATGDPGLAWVKRDPARFAAYHVREFKSDRVNQANMGIGDVPWPDLFRAAGEPSSRAYILERDFNTNNPRAEIETARIGFEYLRKLRF